MSDTLVMFCDLGDALCADVIEPHHKPWRLVFTNADELAKLVTEAINQDDGMSVESARAVLTDSLAPLIEWDQRRWEWRLAVERDERQRDERRREIGAWKEPPAVYWKRRFWLLVGGLACFGLGVVIQLWKLGRL